MIFYFLVYNSSPTPKSPHYKYEISLLDNLEHTKNLVAAHRTLAPRLEHPLGALSVAANTCLHTHTFSGGKVAASVPCANFASIAVRVSVTRGVLVAAWLANIGAEGVAFGTNEAVASCAIATGTFAEGLAIPGLAHRALASGAVSAATNVAAGAAVVGVVLEVHAGVRGCATQRLRAGARADSGSSSSGGCDGDGWSNSLGGRGNGSEDGLSQLSSRGEEHGLGNKGSLGQSSGSGNLSSSRCQSQAAAGSGDSITSEAGLDSGRGCLTRRDRGGSGSRRRCVDLRGDLGGGDDLARVGQWRGSEDLRGDLGGGDDLA